MKNQTKEIILKDSKKVMQLEQWKDSRKYEEKQTIRSELETSSEEVRIGAVKGPGNSSEMWGGETTQ